MNQPSPDLFNQPVDPSFDGRTYDPSKDHKRLTSAMDRALDYLKDGQPRTLKQIADACGCSEAGASARTRDLRKARFREKYGNYNMKCRRGAAGGLWLYSLEKQ